MLGWCIKDEKIQKEVGSGGGGDDDDTAITASSEKYTILSFNR
jgi:hypothetical protein